MTVRGVGKGRNLLENKVSASFEALEYYLSGVHHHEYPVILDSSNANLVYSLPLEYETNELEVHVSQEYPFLYKNGHKMITFEEHPPGTSPQAKSNKKVKIGISFNGRQFPGAHNMIQGLLDDNV